MGSFVARCPRSAAALSFGAAACGVSSLWFLPSIVARPDVMGLVLFIGAPGTAAAVAGALGGASLCDPKSTHTARQASFRGVGIATLALVLFAPLFAMLYQWSARGQSSIMGLTVAVLSFSLVAAWWVAAVVGAGLGWLLYRLGSRRPAV